jgi:hypothetical protein
MLRRGQALVNNGRIEDALIQFEKAIELDPSDNNIQKEYYDAKNVK